MAFRTEIRVRYAETDQMGVAYHSNYFVWMEVGRTELFRNINLSYKEIEENGIIFPVIDASCRYKEPALYDDEILVETIFNNYSAVKAEINYNFLRKKDESLLASGKTVHGIVNKNSKPVSIKKLPWLKEKFDKMLEK